jgi:hypothetical protein
MFAQIYGVRRMLIEDIGGRTAQLAEMQVLDIYENVKIISMSYNSCIFYALCTKI